MLPKDEWLDAAQQLKPGRSRRLPHHCGGGSPLVVYANADGWSCWCHRCQEGGSVAKELTKEERLAKLTGQANADAEVEADLDPPWPPVRNPEDWPQNAQAWLLRAGFSFNDIRKHGWFYHRKSDRVVLPILSGSEVIFWTARAVEFKDRAKYLMPTFADRSKIVARYGSGPTLVLCEDILSAAKVGMNGVTAWALLGTKVPPGVLVELMRWPGPILVWLDPDDPGQAGARKIRKTLAAAGIDSRNVVSSKDPKLLFHSEIQEVLRAYV